MDGRSMCALADQELASFLSASELETAHHRMCKQENKCGFGLKGLCCRLCSNGPCRITKNADRGVCGATADVIAAREFLRAVAAGSAAYLHLTEQAAMRLARMESRFRARRPWSDWQTVCNSPMGTCIIGLPALPGPCWTI